jgi:hypothetical protein
MENKKQKNEKNLVSPLKTRISKDGKWFLFDMGSHTVIVSVAYLQAILTNLNNGEKKGA